MYAFLRGIIAEKNQHSCVLECGGVGYEVICTQGALANLGAPGEVGFVHTLLHVREDEMSLFGFQSVEEKRMYTRLVSVSGIGPKLAITVLRNLSVHDLALALTAKDDKRLASVPGIGKKTAQRMILELNEQAANEFAGAGLSSVTQPSTAAPSLLHEAAEVLVSLGFTPSEAVSAAQQCAAGHERVEDIVKAVLTAMDAARRG